MNQKDKCISIILSELWKVTHTHLMNKSVPRQYKGKDKGKCRRQKNSPSPRADRNRNKKNSANPGNLDLDGPECSYEFMNRSSIIL